MDLLQDKIEHKPQETPSMTERELKIYLKEVRDWEVISTDLPLGCSGLLRKEVRFQDYETTMEYANKVATVSEKLQHHPDMLVQWGLVTISIYTHTIGGISTNDFILAAHIDQL